MEQDRAVSHVATSRGLNTLHVFGAAVHLHFTFVLLLILMLVSGFDSADSPAVYLCYVAAIVASVLGHELAHAMIGWACGIHTVEVTLFPTGGVSRFDRAPGTRQEFWIASAGPLANFLIAASLFGVLAAHFKLSRDGWDLVDQIALGNLVLGLFNLLPAAPMDGGRILRSLLSQFQPELAAARNAAWAGRFLAVALGLFGLLSGHYVLLVMAFCVFLGVNHEGAASVGRQLAHGIPVRDVMLTEYQTLSHGATVGDADHLLQTTSQRDFPVVYGDQVLGLVNRRALRRALVRQGPEAYVAAVMHRQYPTLSPDLDLADVLPAMARVGSCALVMQGERLLGLLTSENLSQFLLQRRLGMPSAETRG